MTSIYVRLMRFALVIGVGGWLAGCGFSTPPAAGLPGAEDEPKVRRVDFPTLKLSGSFNGQDSIFIQAYLADDYPDQVVSGQALMKPHYQRSGAPGQVYLVQGLAQPDGTYKLCLGKRNAPKCSFAVCGRMVSPDCFEGEYSADSAGNRTQKLVLTAMSETDALTYRELSASALTAQMSAVKDKQSLQIGVNPQVEEYKLVFAVSKSNEDYAHAQGFFVAKSSPSLAYNPAIQYLPLQESRSIKSRADADIYQFIKSCVELIDLNADGYLDIRLLVKQMKSQEHYRLFMYNPTSREFVDWGGLINPVIDEKAGELTGYKRFNPEWDYLQTSYEIEKGLFVVRRVEESVIQHHPNRQPGAKDSLLRIVTRWERGSPWKFSSRDSSHVVAKKPR